MEKQPLREFFDALKREEAVIREWIAEDAFGFRMRLAINELDLELEGALRTGRETEADEERAYLMRLGVNRMVKLAFTVGGSPTRTAFEKPPAGSPAVVRKRVETCGIRHIRVVLTGHTGNAAPKRGSH